jgi:hypothetical protein
MKVKSFYKPGKKLSGLECAVFIDIVLLSQLSILFLQLAEGV